MTAVNDFVTMLKGQLDSVGATPKNTQASVDQLLRFKRATMRYGGDAAAATDGTYQIVDLPYAGTIQSITIMPEGAVTASATVFKTLTFEFADGAGGSATTIGSCKTDLVGNSGTGNWVANTRITVGLTATIANRSWGANSIMRLTTTHASTGTQLPIFLITVVYSEDGP